MFSDDNGRPEATGEKPEWVDELEERKEEAENDDDEEESIEDMASGMGVFSEFFGRALNASGTALGGVGVVLLVILALAFRFLLVFGVCWLVGVAFESLVLQQDLVFAGLGFPVWAGFLGVFIDMVAGGSPTSSSSDSMNMGTPP